MVIAISEKYQNMFRWLLLIFELGLVAATLTPTAQSQVETVITTVEDDETSWHTPKYSTANQTTDINSTTTTNNNNTGRSIEPKQIHSPKMLIATVVNFVACSLLIWLAIHLINASTPDESEIARTKSFYIDRVVPSDTGNNNSDNSKDMSKRNIFFNQLGKQLNRLMSNATNASQLSVVSAAPSGAESSTSNKSKNNNKTLKQSKKY